MENLDKTLKVGGIAFVSGIITGVITGLLSAPTSGIRTRRKISRVAERVGSHTYNKVDQVKQTLDTVLQDGKALVNLK